MAVRGKATATVSGTVIAETDEWEVVEGNVYFPPASVKREYMTGPTDLHTFCPWKGEASYYTIDVNGNRLENAAWFYPSPMDKAENIRDHVAFYKTKVQVSASST